MRTCPFLLDGRTLAAGDSFTFVTNLGSLDVLGTPSGTKGYRDLASAAVAIPVAEDLSVRVVALADLMRMKRASARIKDKMHLEVLAALQEMLETDFAGMIWADVRLHTTPAWSPATYLGSEADNPV